MPHDLSIKGRVSWTVGCIMKIHLTKEVEEVAETAVGLIPLVSSMYLVECFGRIP
jgi:hypothetical protein